MARCIFCDEWAGPDSDRHKRCTFEYESQMRQPGLIRRLFTRLVHSARAVYAVVSGS